MADKLSNTLSDQMAKNTGTATVPSGVVVSYINVEKINKIVWFHFLGSKSQWAEGDVLCTLPSGYRPSVAVHTFATNYNMPSDNVQIGIGTDGNVVIWNKGVQPQGNIYSQHLTVADHLILYVDVGADKACTVFQGGGLTHYNYHISSYTSWNIGTGVSISATAYYVDK